MIDLGIAKLALIGVVALVVIGPERLPRMARMAGALFGRAQRYIRDVKSEVGREIELDELRKMHTEIKDAASGVERTIARNISEIESDAQESFVNPVLTPMPEYTAVNASDFRKKKLARSSSIPSWYKKQQGHKTRVISGAARVARFRPQASTRNSSAPFF